MPICGSGNKRTERRLRPYRDNMSGRQAGQHLTWVAEEMHQSVAGLEPRQ